MAPVNKVIVTICAVAGLINMELKKQRLRTQEATTIAAFYVTRKMLAKRNYSKKTEWVFATHNQFWEKAVPTMTDERFRRKYRVSRRVFNYLVETLGPHLQRQDTVMRNAIPVEKRIAIALHVLKSNCDYDTIAQAYGVGQSTVCFILKDFCKVIGKVLGPRHVTLPTAATDLDDVVQGFRNRWNFPNCVGALDSTHIPIKSPAKYPEDYYNYKGWKSIHCLAIVDHDYKFRYAHIGAAGKNNDGEVFKKCSLSNPEVIEKMCPTNRDYHIISDGAFKMEKWLMKPFPEFRGVTDVQANFNFRLSRARMIVECAFGRLKARWRILLKRCDFKLGDMPSIVFACIILHNVCEEFQDSISKDWIKEMRAAAASHPQPESPYLIENVVPSDAKAKRDALASALFDDPYHQAHLSVVDAAILRVANRQSDRND